MRPFAKTALVMALTVFLVFAIASLIAIYLFGSYEPAWGRGASLQVSWWLSLGGAILVMLGAGTAAKLGGDDHIASTRSVAIAGVSFALVSIAVVWLLSVVEFPYSHLLIFPWFGLVPALIAYY